ncbi:MAG: beta-lactamase family protein [Clostridia bacterium]|nr:beta-lactamase family protein [Clostridia bacterium]
MNTIDFCAADQRIQELIRRDRLPNASVCVCGPDGVIFEKGYGYRDKDFTYPVDGDTVYGIASMSKSITALAIAILECEGKLSYDDPVARYFPDFSVPGAPKDMVTLRTLAQHTAGIPPIEPLEWSIAMNSPGRDSKWIRNMRASSPNRMDRIEQIIDYIARCPYPTVGAPGENMSYCNEGYAVLSYVVDQEAGMPLEAFCQERVFAPLGMTRTLMDNDCVSAHSMAGDNIVSLFEYEGDTLVCDDHWSVLPPFRGCAMVKSTARDMAAYYRCLSNYGVHEGRQVLPRAAVERMIGAEIPATDQAVYGLGLYKRVKAGHVVCEHSGGLHGVSTKGGLLLGEGYGFAVLCSLGDADMDDIMWTLYNAVTGLPLSESHRWFCPVDRVFSDLPMLEGSYIAHEGEPAVVRVDASGHVRVSGHDADLVYCGAGRFLAMDRKDPEKMRARLEFFFRDGRAWGVRVGSRIYSRETEPSPA